MTFCDVLAARKEDKATLTEASLRLAETPCFALLTTWSLTAGDEDNNLSFELMRFRLERQRLCYSILHAIIENVTESETRTVAIVPFLMVKSMPYELFKKTLMLNNQVMGVYRSLSKVKYKLGSMVETLAEGQVFCYYSKSGALKVLGDFRPARIALEFGKVYGHHVTFSYPAQTWTQRIIQFFNRR